MTDPYVLFAVPTRGNDIFWKLLVYLLGQLGEWKRVNLLMGLCGFKAAAEALMQAAARWKGADFVHFVDADVGPQPGSTEKLIARDVDIVTAPVWQYSAKDNLIHLNISYQDASIPTFAPQKAGLQKIRAASMASVVVKTKVLHRFLKDGESFTAWTEDIDTKLRKAGPDVIFFEKARNYGFDAYVDWDVGFSTHNKLVGLDDTSIEKFVFRRFEAATCQQE